VCGQLCATVLLILTPLIDNFSTMIVGGTLILTAASQTDNICYSACASTYIPNYCTLFKNRTLLHFKIILETLDQYSYMVGMLKPLISQTCQMVCCEIY